MRNFLSRFRQLQRFNDLEMQVGNPIFLDYSQEELNRNFDQRALAHNALEVIARYAKLSAATRERFPYRTAIPYGDDPDEVLDFFPADRRGGPIQIFVHGGAVC
jgi:arylformamidase